MARNTNREACNYDQLFAGEVDSPVTIVVGAAGAISIKRGDVLENIVPATVVAGAVVNGAPAAKWNRIADDAVTANMYAIAAEDAEVGAGGSKTIVAYRDGEFNINKLRFATGKTAAGSELVLGEKGIVLRSAASGTVTNS